VTDQRLVVEAQGDGSRSAKNRRKSSRLAVEAASADIAGKMLQVDSAYARASQLQDRGFPREVIEAMNVPEVIPLSDLERLVAEVERTRKRLREVGLLDSDEGFEPVLAAESLEQENVRPVIAAFLRSTVRKLNVLQDLEGRLRAFKDFLDERFTGKDMTLGRHDGVRFLLKGQSSASIRPAQLSSGEQQMMVLAYEILFRTQERTLVIVDEPEISLHVLWQDTLIENLTAMGASNSLQYLLATHSPMLLASHPEIERSLDAEDSYGQVPTS
jgi:hypothetical protein